jgi:hypothetical protein
VASVLPAFITPNSLTNLRPENNVTCSVPNARTSLPSINIYDLISTNSGCTCVNTSGAYACDCNNANNYENIKGASYNLACLAYGRHFGDYAGPQQFYPTSCDNPINSLTPIPGLFDLLYSSFTFRVPPSLVYESLTLDEISLLLGWGCYDYNTKQQSTLFSNTKRNCPFTLETGNILHAWSQPLNQFNEPSNIAYKDFMCCANNDPSSIVISNCSYQTSCWDSPYCAQILYNTCSTNMRLPFNNSVSVANSSLSSAILCNNIITNLGNAFTIPYDFREDTGFILITATLSGTLTEVGGAVLSSPAIWYLTRNNNLAVPLDAYSLPTPASAGIYNTAYTFTISSFLLPGDIINMIFDSGSGNIPGAMVWSNVLYDYNGAQVVYQSRIPTSCNNWLKWAQGQTSQTNAPAQVTGMAGAFDLSADAAFQSVIDYCKTTNTNNCVGISLTNYSQIFPRTPFLLFDESYNTSDPYQVVVPFKNVFFKSISALLVVDAQNASFNLNNITPRSITLGPQETAAFSVTLAQVVSSYTTSPGPFYKITTQSNWPWYPQFGGTRTDFGPGCNYDGFNPTISNPINTATYQEISPPLCEIGDNDISDSVPLPPGGIRIIDLISGNYVGVSISTSFSGPFFSSTGLGNNPFDYDCESTLQKYYQTADVCFNFYNYLFFPFYGMKPICYWPSVSVYPPNYGGDQILGCAKELQASGVYNIATTPSWPSCVNNRQIQGNPIVPYAACEGVPGFQRCQYNIANPADTAFQNPLYNPFQSCFLNQGSYYPPLANGICDPFIQNNATYTTIRVCQSTNISGQLLNFYIQDVSLQQPNSNQSNRTTNSLDYPILGGFLATVGPDTSSNILSATKAYAYGFSLDSAFSEFFNV